MKKLSNTLAELKKAFLIKKTRVSDDDIHNNNIYSAFRDNILTIR